MLSALCSVIAAMRWTRIREVLHSNLSRDTRYREDIRCFPQSLHENAGTILLLDHGRFIPDPFQFISILPLVALQSKYRELRKVPH
jgi:hypothetical protein